MLPKPELPQYEITIPVTNRKLKFRVYTVQEQELQLIAEESSEEIDRINATKQIIDNVVITPVDVDKLSLFELEYLQLNLRARSVKETSNYIVFCDNIVGGDLCDGEIPVVVNILDLKIDNDKAADPVIKVTDDMGFKLRYPNYVAAEKFKKDVIAGVAECIECVYEGDEVYDSFTSEDAIDFIKGLPINVFQKVVDFFNKAPKLYIEVKYKCPKCSHEGTVRIQGFEDFFD